MAKHKHRDPIRLRPHHSKPYRIHHLGLLILSLLVVVLVAIELGIVLGHDQGETAPKPVIKAETSANSNATINSGYGYALRVNTNQFNVVASTPNPSDVITKQQLDKKLNISSVKIRPKAGAVSSRSGATVLTIDVNSDPTAYSTLHSRPENAGLSQGLIAKQLFPLVNAGDFKVEPISSKPDTLNGTPVQRTEYKYTSKQGGTSYAIVWTGVVNGRAFAVKLDGLVGSATVPEDFTSLIATLKMSSDQAVLGASTDIFATQTKTFNGKLDAKYLSDAVSPAVVQIFHTVCGVLTINGQALGGSTCTSVSGSGFMATQDGYIATNGHVVVYSAKDALANLVTNNEVVLKAYLRAVGLSDSQILLSQSNPSVMAGLISKIYDMPDSQVSFSNKGEMILVALGRNVPSLGQLSKVTSTDQLGTFMRDTDSIKQATVIGYNYSAKDQYTAVADPAKGFSSSDVALIKVNVKQAPTIPIESAPVVQNQKIVLMGFPGDASNPLIDNSYNDVTVTDGVISSIRQAAGGKAQLYQSDVDASHGNSGGPAIDEQGRVIGLLTYRYVDSQSGNAAKSYIRDIADFSDLAKDQAVNINSASKTQAIWLSGLQNYSNHHYSRALKDFNQVYSVYPSHRLVASYIYSSKQAIKNGQDVKDVPVNLLIFILLISIIGLATTIYIVVRHHALHKVYQVSQTDQSGHRRAVVLADTTPHDQA